MTASSKDSQLRIPRGVQPVRFRSVRPGDSREIESEVVEEGLACISVNGRELATFMCTPDRLDELAIGFLFNEGIVSALSEIENLHISGSNCVDIWLDREFTPPERQIVTAGCGGGVTFEDYSERHPPLESEIVLDHGSIAARMREALMGAELYRRSRGIHTAALADSNEILLQVEDIGRHNCLDRLMGAARLAGMETRGRILISSGRISSEMINKARRLETPIVCSRTSPTSLSVQLADSWNITIAAYVRQQRMRIYTHPERIRTDPPAN